MYIRHFIDEYKLSVVAVCETWLVPSVYSFVAVDGFHILRGDCSQSVRKHGCCLYVAKSLSFVQVDVGFINVAGVLRSDLDVYVLAVYRPPSYSAAQEENLLSFLDDFCIERKVIILGEKIFPSLDWSSENVAGEYVPSRELLFFYRFSLLGLCQWVREGTFMDSNNILDLIPLKQSWVSLSHVSSLPCHF